MLAEAAGRRRWLTGHLPAALWTVAVAVLLTTPGDSIPFAARPSWLDSAMHVLLFLVHGGLLRRSLAALETVTRPGLAAFLGSGLWALLLEAAQIGIPGRSWQWPDLMLGLLGAACGAAVPARRARVSPPS